MKEDKKAKEVKEGGKTRKEVKERGKTRKQRKEAKERSKGSKKRKERRKEGGQGRKESRKEGRKLGRSSLIFIISRTYLLAYKLIKYKKDLSYLSSMRRSPAQNSDC